MDYTEAASKPSPLPANSVTDIDTKSGLVRGISLADATLLIVGGIIGTGVFLTAGDVAAATKTPLVFVAAWVAGMIVSWLASVSVAELGSMFPQAGGQYVYLREAYGEFPAFLYGWMIFAVGQSGTIAALAVGFAEYFGAVFPVASAHVPVATFWRFTLTRGDLSAMTAIAVLTVINVLGLKRGSGLVNVATWAKFAAMGAFVVLGLAV